ncbi:MAG: hypothetical protein PHZ28_05385 [Candidatus Izemoplasmatales bacterium]|nr:hypothetical protein [Candidatus Izemoplasmatales bacterium]
MKSSERLEEILKYLKISANKLSVEIGLKDNTKIYHIKKDRNDISPEMAKLITDRFSEINYSWLLTGEGEMLNNQTMIHEPPTEHYALAEKEKIIEWLNRELEDKRGMIRHLIDESNQKNNEINRLKSELDMLKEELKKKEPSLKK